MAREPYKKVVTFEVFISDPDGKPDQNARDVGYGRGILRRITVCYTAPSMSDFKSVKFGAHLFNELERFRQQVVGARLYEAEKKVAKPKKRSK